MNKVINELIWQKGGNSDLYYDALALRFSEGLFSAI